MEMETTAPGEAHDFWVSVVILTLLSALGSLFIIIGILLKYRSDFSARLVLYLSVADFCLSVVCGGLCAYNLSNGHLQSATSAACLIQPVVTWYFIEASMLWLTVIAVHSTKVVFKGQPFSQKEDIIANVICWSLPLFTATLPLSRAGQAYGPRNGLWCSFAQNMKAAQLGNIMAYYIPCLVIIVCCYAAIGYRFYQITRKSESSEVTGNTHKEMILVVRKLFMYVASYVIIWSPLAFCYIYEAATGNFVSFWVELFSDNLMHIQGICNFILYGINENLLQNFRDRFFKSISTSLKMDWMSSTSKKDSSKFSHGEESSIDTDIEKNSYELGRKSVTADIDLVGS